MSTSSSHIIQCRSKNADGRAVVSRQFSKGNLLWKVREGRERDMEVWKNNSRELERWYVSRAPGHSPSKEQAVIIQCCTTVTEIITSNVPRQGLTFSYLNQTQTAHRELPELTTRRRASKPGRSLLSRSSPRPQAGSPPRSVLGLLNNAKLPSMPSGYRTPVCLFLRQSYH